ncbi:hypothetical protein D3C87_1912820 [compost metagenome]
MGVNPGRDFPSGEKQTARLGRGTQRRRIAADAADYLPDRVYAPDRDPLVARHRAERGLHQAPAY